MGTEIRASDTSRGRAEDDNFTRGEDGALRLLFAGLEVIELAAVSLSS